MKTSSPRRVLALVGFPLLLACLAALVVVFRRELWQLFSSRDRLEQWIEGWGAAARLAFVGVQALQVIVFVIPGEVPQIAGGYLFGVLQGTALSVAGILVGSTVSFFLARLLGRPFVTALFSGEQVARIEKLAASRGARIVFFLLFLIPGILKDILCYAAGITPMGFLYFAGISTLGRMPGIVGSAVMGSAAASGRWVLMAVVAGGAIVLFAAGLVLRPRIQAWLEAVAERRRGGATRRGGRRRSARRTPRPS